MLTQKCISCEYGREKLIGKVCIEFLPTAKGIDTDKVHICDNGEDIDIIMVPGSTYLLSIDKQIELCIVPTDLRYDIIFEKVYPDRFNHLLIEHDYGYDKECLYVANSYLKNQMQK